MLPLEDGVDTTTDKLLNGSNAVDVDVGSCFIMLLGRSCNSPLNFSAE